MTPLLLPQQWPLQVWLPSMVGLEGADEKLVLVATARCLTDLPVLQARDDLAMMHNA